MEENDYRSIQMYVLGGAGLGIEGCIEMYDSGGV